MEYRDSISIQDKKSQGPFYNTTFSSLSQLNEDLQAVSKKLDQNGLEGDSKP